MAKLWVETRSAFGIGEPLGSFGFWFRTLPIHA
jgi:hypothetical protein